MKIDVLTYATGRNAIGYAEFCGEMLRKYASGNHEIRYVCASGETRRVNGWDMLHVKGKHPISNSMTHAVAMNNAISNLYADVCVVIDADCAVVYPSWDNVVVAETNNVDFWGWQIPSGSKRGAPNFPCIFFMAFKRRAMLPPMIMDFRPLVAEGQERVTRMLIEDKWELNVYGIGPTGIIKCDTGYRLPYFAAKAGRTSGVIPYVRQDSDNRKLPYLNNDQRRLCLQKPTHMAEWHYNGELFGTHKQACRNHPLTEGWGLAWKQRIERYIDDNWSTL